MDVERVLGFIIISSFAIVALVIPYLISRWIYETESERQRNRAKLLAGGFAVTNYGIIILITAYELVFFSIAIVVSVAIDLFAVLLYGLYTTSGKNDE